MSKKTFAVYETSALLKRALPFTIQTTDRHNECLRLKKQFRIATEFLLEEEDPRGIICGNVSVEEAPTGVLISMKGIESTDAGPISTLPIIAALRKLSPTLPLTEQSIFELLCLFPQILPKDLDEAREYFLDGEGILDDDGIEILDRINELRRP